MAYCLNYTLSIGKPIMRAICIFVTTVYLLATGAQAAASVPCQRDLKERYTLPALEFSSLEQEISRALYKFFDTNPQAQVLFRAAFYGETRNAINHTLQKAFENIPLNKRAEITKDALLEVLSERSSSRQKFVKRIIEVSFSQSQKPDLLQLSSYSYFNFLEILAMYEKRGDRVLVLQEGRGEYALHQDRTTKVTRYFQLNKIKRTASQIDKDTFYSALQWQQRSLKNQGLLAASIHVFRRDRVQAYEQSLQGDLKLAWRYVMNSLSNESYLLVGFLLKKGVAELEHNFDTSGTKGPSKINVFRFVDFIWKQAATLEYTLKIDQDVYSALELRAILNAFQIYNRSMDAGSEGYRIFQFGNETFYFVKEVNKENQWVFRRKTQGEFESLQENKKARNEEMFKYHESASEITPNMDPSVFPDEIIQIPEDRLEALNITLNPGYISTEGFKQSYENLADLIHSDAQDIQESGFTHKQLAEWLVEIIRLKKLGLNLITINGKTLEIIELGSKGYQNSPFGDRITWTRDYIVLDLDTGKRIQFSGGHPYMIGHYGFFEGNVPYRLSPVELIEFLGDLK